MVPRLDTRKYSFSQRVINEWNKLCVNMFKNLIYRYTLDKPMASLSSCYLELVVWDGNLVKSYLKNLVKQPDK